MSPNQEAPGTNLEDLEVLQSQSQVCLTCICSISGGSFWQQNSRVHFLKDKCCCQHCRQRDIETTSVNMSQSQDEGCRFVPC